MVKQIVIEVEKGIILELKRENYQEIYIKLRKANENETQPEINGHYGYKDREVTRYFFD